MLAKTIASLDHLSGGRVLLGIGVGWNEDEMEQHGVDPKRRRSVAREHVLAMRELWTQEEASFDGEHVQFSSSWSWPKPVSDPYPPILMGGAGGPVTFRHVVEYCDGWMPIHGRRNIADKLDELRRAADEAGRDMSTIELGVFGCPPDNAVIDSYAELGLHPLRPRRARRPARTTRCGPSTAPPTSSPSTPSVDRRTGAGSSASTWPGARGGPGEPANETGLVAVDASGQVLDAGWARGLDEVVGVDGASGRRRTRWRWSTRRSSCATRPACGRPSARSAGATGGGRCRPTPPTSPCRRWPG